MTSPRPQVSNATAPALVQLVEPIAVVTYLAPAPTEAVMALGAGTMWDACFAPGPRAGPVSGFWPLVRRERITMTTMLGAISELLQQQAPTPDDADNPMELAIMAPLASDIDAFRGRFDVGLIPVYGMSEIGCVMASAPEDTIPGEAGSSRGNYDLRLVDDEGRDVPDGTVGQLLVRPHVPHTVMAAYHNLPEKTAETVRDGWVHTGDAFTRDADGHYRFVDRIKDALRRRGENISSFELEGAINQFPDVCESAVVGVPSPEFNEDEVKAVVVLREGAEPDPVN